MKNDDPHSELAFFRHYALAIERWEELYGEIQCAVIACSEEREFTVIQRHYRAAEDHARGIQEQIKFLLFLLPPERENSSGQDDLHIQKKRALVSFLERSCDLAMCHLMNVYRPWLREEHLRQAREEIPDASS